MTEKGKTAQKIEEGKLVIEIKGFKIHDLHKGDILVFQTQGILIPEQYDIIMQMMERTFPGNKILLLDDIQLKAILRGRE